MFKIGDFSKLTRVPMRTLHYYDQIGLFKPLHVDPFTGYRYYSFEQLPRLHRLLVLRDLGFPLEQIGQILDEPLSAEQLEGMLKLRQAELQAQVNEGLARLARVGALIGQIKQEGKMSDHEIMLKHVEPIWVASARAVVSTPEQMREGCMTLLEEVCELLAQHGLKSTDTALALYYDNNERGIDVEMAMILENGAPTDVQHKRAKVYRLPAQEMAVGIYRGSYDDFEAVGALHKGIGKWIEQNGYRVADASREIYLQTPQLPGGDGLMELQYPVMKA
jgi:DNA-binding transcriptional MerR regulator